MKKIWLCAISLLLIFALTACGDTSENTSAGTTSGSPTPTDSTTKPATTSADPDVGPTTTSGTDSGSGGEKPSIGKGIFDGLNLSEIWDKVMGSLSDSTGFDVTVASSSEYSVDGESQTEDQNVQIQFNADTNGYSYSIRTQTDRVVDGQPMSESLWQAYKDGWFYQSADLGGETVTGRIPIDETALAEQGLDAETILALNAMLDMGEVSIDGESLEWIFKEVTFETLEDGRYKITCKGINTEKLMELLSSEIGEIGDGEDGDYGALIEGIAQLLDGSLEMEISKDGLPEKITSQVSLSMSEPMAFSVSTGYTLTVNAMGAGAGKVTLPSEAAAYPEFESYEDYLAALYVGITQE